VPALCRAPAPSRIISFFNVQVIGQPCICASWSVFCHAAACRAASVGLPFAACTLTSRPDRKSTRLNSSHITISYAVFCLKKKKKKQK